jgi:DNA-binding NarL/FixJ family response regulator
MRPREADEAAIARAVAGEPPVPMSPAERGAAVRILRARGLSIREVAERIGCSARTVQRHSAPAAR